MDETGQYYDEFELERRWVKGGFWYTNDHGDEEFVDCDEWEEHVKQ